MTKPGVPSAEPKAPKSRYWSSAEHQLFLQGLKKYGPSHWKEIASIVGTKDAGQVRSHNQKFVLSITNGHPMYHAKRFRDNQPT